MINPAVIPQKPQITKLFRNDPVRTGPSLKMLCKLTCRKPKASARPSAQDPEIKPQLSESKEIKGVAHLSPRAKT